tara:strand:- start:5 stop:556 length:552 start_codon:yes stop_codon:yes gene_type:complete
MPTVNLLPNADVSNDPAWTLSTGSDIWALLDDDATEEPSSDSNQITATATGKQCEIQFTSFDNTHVASIDSVQAVVKAVVYARGQRYNFGIRIGNNGAGAASWSEETTGTTNSFHNWRTHTFTARETSTSGGSDWNDTDVDNMTMEITLGALSGNTMRVSYAYFIVTYTAAVTDNAIFFGTNF